jgi:hypothetical protein
MSGSSDDDIYNWNVPFPFQRGAEKPDKIFIFGQFGQKDRTIITIYRIRSKDRYIVLTFRYTVSIGDLYTDLNAFVSIILSRIFYILTVAKIA